MKKKYSVQILMLLMVTLFVGCSDDNDQQVDNLLQSRLAAKKFLKGSGCWKRLEQISGVAPIRRWNSTTTVA